MFTFKCDIMDTDYGNIYFFDVKGLKQYLENKEIKLNDEICVYGDYKC